MNWGHDVGALAHSLWQTVSIAHHMGPCIQLLHKAVARVMTHAWLLSPHLSLSRHKGHLQADSLAG